MKVADVKVIQDDLCKRLGVEPLDTLDSLKVGIALNVRSGLQPINGLRLNPKGDTSGWYIWAGEEMSADPNFFVPLHIVHLTEWCPVALPYLQLPPGWRFLRTPNYEDVWFDPELDL